MYFYFCIFILLLNLNLNTALNEDEDQRNSVAFVIDNTGSMKDDIDQVKSGANAIFDTILTRNPKQFKNYILITFNDPDVRVRAITNDPEIFKNELSAINIEGGGDCPEMAMSGIATAIEESMPGSYIYVFTDASAKDHVVYDKVRDLAQRKGSQVTFVLTGICESLQDPGYLVYPWLAAASSGQVFHLEKNDVDKILNYVTETVKSRKNEVARKTFAPGYGNLFNYTLDKLTDEVLISVVGFEPEVTVVGKNGKIPTRNVVSTPNVSIVSFQNREPGNYLAEVGSKSNTTAVVTGSTDVYFQHGFSVNPPTSLRDTTTKPIPATKSYLGIKLFGQKGDIHLKVAELIDNEGNVLTKLPLRLVDGPKKFYVTEPFVPINKMFKIRVRGHDAESLMKIARTSATTIEPQNPTNFVKLLNKAPVISLDEKIMAEFGQPLRLSCHINAYPRPAVQWEQKDLDIIYKTTVTPVELPYDYVSVFNIEKVTANATFYCIAYNAFGKDIKRTQVITPDKIFKMLAYPNDTTVEYGKEAIFHCRLLSIPPGYIIWYKNGKQLHVDENIEISNNGIMKIKNVSPSSEGLYSCEALNIDQRRVFQFKVTGKAKSILTQERENDEIYTVKGHNNQNVKSQAPFVRLHNHPIEAKEETLRERIRRLEEEVSYLKRQIDDFEGMKKGLNSITVFANSLVKRVESLEMAAGMRIDTNPKTEYTKPRKYF